MEESYKRPSWDEYFMEIVHAVAKRATCDRGRGGCVIAKDKQILVTGSVIKSGENWNIEGNMILVDKSTYSVIAFYKAGYANEIDRIIKTLVIK
jgi:deoxycytidylate deaminase